MKIHAYITCYNEEQILPFTLDHYSRACERVFLLDNESTDDSREIASRYANVEVSSWSSNNEFDELAITSIRNSRYRGSRGLCDWVVVCDADEILYGIEGMRHMLDQGIRLPRIEGYQMVSDDFPVYDGRPITEFVKTGFRDRVFDKQIAFDPNLDLTFGPGSHTFHCATARDERPSGLKLLHYRHLGLEHMHGKDRTSGARLSLRTRQLGLCGHYSQTDEQAAIVFASLKAVSKPVI